MAIFETSDGCHLHYQLEGSSRQPTLVLTPGGREGGHALQPLIKALSPHFQVLSWDRRNCGNSDLYFDPNRSEQTIWAEDLIALLQHLKLPPAWIAGGSAGCRVSLNAVLRNPEIARGVLLWSASGGAYSSQFLGFSYHVPYIMAAQAGGMKAVANTPFFAERITNNPRNRDYLLGLDANYFIATMKRWNESFYHAPDQPLTGIEGNLCDIKLPTLIFEGNDDIHTTEAARGLAEQLCNATLVTSPWSGKDFQHRFLGLTQESVFDLYPKLVPDIIAYTHALNA